MLRSKNYWFALALLAVAGITSACTRADVTGPSDSDRPAFENTGGGH